MKNARMLVSVVALGLSACATTPSPAGRWASACTPQPQADGSTSYFDLNFDITEQRWDLDYVVYGDAQCGTKLVTVKIAGPYQMERASEKVEGAYEARFDFDTKSITPHVDGLAGALQQMGCGSSAWTVGQGQSVFEQGCTGFGQYPKAQCSADYDLVKVEGDKLRFGQRPADNNMCTPDKRPTALSPLVLTRK